MELCPDGHPSDKGFILKCDGGEALTPESIDNFALDFTFTFCRRMALVRKGLYLKCQQSQRQAVGVVVLQLWKLLR